MFELVVARYNENLDWLSRQQHPFAVYNKGEPLDIACENLKNIGREAQTYLRHIIKRFENLAEYTVFLQGNPYRHSRNLDEALSLLPSSLDSLQALSRGCWSLSDMVLVEEQEKLEHYKIYPKDFHDAFFSVTKRRFRHAYGAQYIVHKSAINNKPVEFYKHIHDSCSWERHEPWSIERVWPSIFDAEDKHRHKIRSFYF